MSPPVPRTSPAGAADAHPSSPAAFIRRAAGLLAIGTGSMVLTGWMLDIEVLKGAGHSITMKPNAATGLIACGISLLCGAVATGWRRSLGMLMGAVAATIGSLTLSQHLVGWNLGIDELIAREAPGAASTASPGRMGPNASLSLTLAGISLLFLQRPSAHAARRAQALGFCMTILAAIALVGYVYGAQQLYSAARYTGIAWPTALALLTIGLGILAARPDAGPVSVLISDGPGGVMARRILMPAVLLPVTLGYVRKLGEAAQLYDSGLGGALLAVTVSSVLALAVWRSALQLDDSARAREAAQRERDELLVRERAAREDAERAGRVKDQFLATLSHELRTPLNAIVGWSDILRTAPLDADRRAHAHEVVARNSRALITLVEDLLDVSRIVSGRLRIRQQSVEFLALVNTVIENLEAEAAVKRITLRANLGRSAIVTGDPERLQQAVANLIANALKFTPAGGSVQVDAVVTTTTVELTVRDNGRGIEPSFLPFVFEPFRQQDATTTREHGGLGLGLSIVRDLVELHRGHITADSPGPGGGSTFTLVLPLEQDAGRSQPTA